MQTTFPCNNNIIIICRNRHIFNVAGCLIRGRRRWSVTYTSPRGPRISEFVRIWNRRAFQEKTLPVSWLDEKLSLLFPRPGREPTTSRTPRLNDKQGVPHPTRSAIGRRTPSVSQLLIHCLMTTKTFPTLLLEMTPSPSVKMFYQFTNARTNMNWVITCLSFYCYLPQKFSKNWSIRDSIHFCEIIINMDFGQNIVLLTMWANLQLILSLLWKVIWLDMQCYWTSLANYTLMVCAV